MRGHTLRALPMRPLVTVCLVLLAVGARAQSGGTLRIESVPPGARATVDGATVRGVTPLDVPVAAGSHRVVVALGGHTTFADTVDVAAGGVARVLARLERTSGTLSVAGVPAGATVTVDGRPVSGLVELPSGTVRVGVRTADGQTVYEMVPVAVGRQTDVAFEGRQFRRARVLLAAFGPGVLQARDGRRLPGLAMTAAVVGGLGTAAAMSVRLKQAQSDNVVSLASYEAATTEQEAVAAREQITNQTSIVRSSTQIRTVAMVAAGVFYAASLVDAFARHIRVPGLTSTVRSPASMSIRLTGASAGTGAGLALRF